MVAIGRALMAKPDAAAARRAEPRARAQGARGELRRARAAGRARRDDPARRAEPAPCGADLQPRLPHAARPDRRHGDVRGAGALGAQASTSNRTGEPASQKLVCTMNPRRLHVAFDRCVWRARAGARHRIGGAAASRRGAAQRAVSDRRRRLRERARLDARPARKPTASRWRSTRSTRPAASTATRSRCTIIDDESNPTDRRQRVAQAARPASGRDHRLVAHADLARDDPARAAGAGPDDLARLERAGDRAGRRAQLDLQDADHRLPRRASDAALHEEAAGRPRSP